MIAAQQISCVDEVQEKSLKFTPKFIQYTDIDEIYRRVHGYHFKRYDDDSTNSTTLGQPSEMELESIDKLRIPLEEKQMDGIELTHIETELLLLLENVTDFLMFRIAPEPPLEVTMALRHAKRVLARSS